MLNQSQWDKLEREFFTNLQDYFNELFRSILKLREKSTKYNDPFARSQLCIALIAIDVFARFNLIFEGVRGDELDKRNEDRFRDWVNKFVLTENNEVYRTQYKKLNLDDHYFWRLRNSMLHFYSFPKTKSKTRTSFVFNVPDEEHKFIKDGFKKMGHQVNFIDLHQLIQAIFTGFTMELVELRSKIDKSPSDYVEIIQYAHEEVMEVNMKTIFLEQNALDIHHHKTAH